MIILDTHTLIWWAHTPNRLPPKVRQLIDRERSLGGVFISSISIWEFNLLVKSGRVNIKMDPESWAEEIENLNGITFIPVDNQIAAKSVNLPGSFHSDPADRIIVATARENGATLITSDQKIRAYKEVQTIWD